MANRTHGTRHLATAVLGGLAAVALALPMSLQLAGQAEAEDTPAAGDPATTAPAGDWDDHPADYQPDGAFGTNATESAATNGATTAHVMLYQAGHKPTAEVGESLGASRYDVINETDDYSATTWSSSHNSGHVKRYDNVTIDVTNTGTGTMSFEIWEDVNNWGDYWCLHNGKWDSAGACDTVTVGPGENFTATVQPNQHQGPWPHYGVQGIYLNYWNSTPPPTPPHHHSVTDHLSDGSTLTTQFDLSDLAEWTYRCDAKGLSMNTTDPAYDQSVAWTADAFRANGYTVTGDSPDSLALMIDVEAKGSFDCG